LFSSSSESLEVLYKELAARSRKIIVPMGENCSKSPEKLLRLGIASRYEGRRYFVAV
jgi:hypothetical protein